MRRNKEDVIKYAALFFVFIISIALGVFLWNKISLPFHNPWEVVGPVTKIQYNPANNITRFIVFIAIPVLLLFTVYLLNIKGLNNGLFTKNSLSSNNKIISPVLSSKEKTLFWVALAGLTITFVINLPTFHSTGKFDPFHEGETLGPAKFYLEGKMPYRDYIFCHGLYQDPLRSILAFQLFGQSIASVRILESLTKILSFTLLLIIVVKLFDKNYFFVLTTMLILIVLHINLSKVFPSPDNTMDKVVRIIPRTIPALSFIITILYFKDVITNLRAGIRRRKLIILSFFFSFIPFAALIYSIDQGFYLMAAYFIFAPILYLTFFRKSAYQNFFIISSLVGIIIAISLFFLLLRGSFPYFYDYAFRDLPKYKELLDGFVYPIQKPKFLLVLILIAANAFWVSYKFIQEMHLNNKQMNISIRSFFEKYLIEFSFLVLSIFFFRTALGRSDQEHIAYSSWIIYLLSMYILFKRYLYKYSISKPLTWVAIIAAFIGIAGFSYYAYKNNLITDNFPVKVSDSEFVPESYKATVSFLKNNLNESETFYTMTSEASWYYLIDKPCPTRFPVVYFAVTNFYQEEIIDDLKKNNVKFIIFKNNYWSNRIDSIQSEERFPLITNYIKQDYKFYKKIYDHELWIHKRYDPYRKPSDAPVIKAGQ